MEKMTSSKVLKNAAQVIIWAGVVLLAVSGFWTLAIARGEEINSVWFVVTALSSFAIAYRFYSKFISKKIMQPDDSIETPAVRLNNGQDYHPTDKRVLFGHHFAAIAGAGPLVGPILAAQMGYLPSTLWIIFGVTFAGAVQDMLAMFFSIRHDGRTVWQIANDRLGKVAGAAFGIFLLIMVAVCMSFLALVCVNAMAESPWAVFSIGMTIPIAIFMGLYAKYLRPGKVVEISLIGFALLIAAIFGGGAVAASPLAAFFTLSPLVLSFALIVYAFVASALPVWLLLAPRDYLSTFMKVGTVILLTVGIFIAHPLIQTAALTQFAFDAKGPVFSGDLFPFLFITIACGALSGFHAMIASGTTPKMIEKETHIRPIGYGAMLTEAFVAIIALVAAICISPGVYFSMNSSPAAIAQWAGSDFDPSATASENAEAAVGNMYIQDINGNPIEITWQSENGEALYGSAALDELASDVGEKSIVSRTGGAPTLAVGMANILHNFLGGKEMIGFWYHFAIMFEALFILSSLDAGTRTYRLQIGEMLATIGSTRAQRRRKQNKPEKPSWLQRFGDSKWKMGSFITSLFAVLGWGALLIMGVTDPNGGIRVMQPLFGITNQLLAASVLLLISYLVLQKGKRWFALVPGVPAILAAVVTLTGAFEKIFSPNTSVGVFSLRQATLDKISSGNLSGTALETAEITVRNSTIQGAMMIVFTIAILIFFGALTKKTIALLKGVDE